MAGYSSTDTWGSLIDEVIAKLQGYTMINDQLCSLAASISSSDTSPTVDEANVVSRGIIEIDQELIYVSSVGGTTLTVPDWGRGFKGTTAAAHSAGAAVTVAPSYPRSIVAREVNNAIRELWPTLFAPKTTDLTITSVDWQYELPADCERIVSVEWKFQDPDGWHPMDGWELTASALTTDFSTGKFISISDPLAAGSSCHVTYAARPTLMTDEDDEFAATTGLPASARDLATLGAALRLAHWVDAARMAVTTVPEDALAQGRQVGNAVAFGRDLRSQYRERLERERQAQALLYPVRTHKVRW